MKREDTRKHNCKIQLFIRIVHHPGVDKYGCSPPETRMCAVLLLGKLKNSSEFGACVLDERNSPTQQAVPRVTLVSR